MRTSTKQGSTKPIQLELYERYRYDHKVVVINNTLPLAARKLLAYHDDGRSSREDLFGKLNSQARRDDIPVRTLRGDQVFFTAATLAQNLARELQMLADEKVL